MFWRLDQIIRWVSDDLISCFPFARESSTVLLDSLGIIGGEVFLDVGTPQSPSLITFKEPGTLDLKESSLWVIFYLHRPGSSPVVLMHLVGENPVKFWDLGFWVCLGFHEICTSGSFLWCWGFAFSNLLLLSSLHFLKLIVNRSELKSLNHDSQIEKTFCRYTKKMGDRIENVFRGMERSSKYLVSHHIRIRGKFGEPR